MRTTVLEASEMVGVERNGSEYVSRIQLEKYSSESMDEENGEYLSSLSSDMSLSSVVDEDGIISHGVNSYECHANTLFVRSELMAFHSTERASDMQATLMILKFYLSFGVLALPQMFYLSGYLLGSAIVLGVTALTTHSILLLDEVNVSLHEQSQKRVRANVGYLELCIRVLGEYGGNVFRFTSAITNVGACIAYIIFFEMYITSVIKELVSTNITHEQAHLVGALCAFIIILPLSTINNAALFFQQNFLGLALSLLAISMMLFRNVAYIVSQDNKAQLNPEVIWRPQNFTLSLGIAVFTLKIAGVSMAIRSHMKTPDSFKRVFINATLATAFIYLVFGIVTQLALGQYTAEVALLNYAPQTTAGFIIRLAYTVSVLMSYPLKFFVFIGIYESLSSFKKFVYCPESFEKGRYEHVYEYQIAMLKRYAFRYLLIILIFMTTLVSMEVSKFISLIGTLGGITNQFVIPQFIYLTHFGNRITKLRKVVAFIIIAASLAAATLGIIRSLEELLDSRAASAQNK